MYKRLDVVPVFVAPSRLPRVLSASDVGHGGDVFLPSSCNTTHGLKTCNFNYIYIYQYTPIYNNNLTPPKSRNKTTHDTNTHTRLLLGLVLVTNFLFFCQRRGGCATLSACFDPRAKSSSTKLSIYIMSCFFTYIYIYNRSTKYICETCLGGDDDNIMTQKILIYRGLRV